MQVSTSILSRLCTLFIYRVHSSQCARRGLQCVRPTESRRGVRKGRGRDAEGNTNGEVTATLELAPRRMRSSREDANHDDDAMEDVEETETEDIKPEMSDS